MNNKGMTLVEVLVTFSLLMVIVIGMFNLILDVKGDLDEQQTAKDFSEFSNLINHDIHMDLLKNKPFAIAIRKTEFDNDDPTKKGKWECAYAKGYISNNQSGACEIDNETERVFNIDVTTTINGATVTLTDSSQTLAKMHDLCHNFFPCAVYAYLTTDSSGTREIKYQVIAISKKKDDPDGFGIKYGNTFEQIPDQKHVNFLKSVPTITIENGFFIIDYPLYATGDDYNYGFKIANPYN